MNLIARQKFEQLYRGFTDAQLSEVVQAASGEYTPEALAAALSESATRSSRSFPTADANPPSANEPTVLCPYCGETNPASRTECQHCATSLTTNDSDVPSTIPQGTASNHSEPHASVPGTKFPSSALMYYRVGTDERGPYTKQQLAAMWQSGHITADAFCRISDGEWVPMLKEFDHERLDTDPSAGASQRARPIRMTGPLKAAVLVLVLVGLGLAMYQNVIPMLTESRRPNQPGVAPPALIITKHEVQKAWDSGHETGFLKGIEHMRRYGEVQPDLVRAAQVLAAFTITEARQKKTRESGGKWDEHFEKAWQSAWVDGWMEGFQKGVRKVFVDGR